MHSLTQVLFLLLFSVNHLPYTSTQLKGDLCHVYLVDVTKVTRTFKKYKAEEDVDFDDKDLASAEIRFPVFETRIMEEAATTKHYRIPSTDMFISATVYYTDESMESKIDNRNSTLESMILGISVSKRKVADAIALENNNAVAEVPYLESVGKIRVKKALIVNRRKYLVGLECDCSAKRGNKK